MNNTNISLKHALTALFRTIFILVLFTAVFILTASTASAESDTVLIVQKDGETVKEFSMEDLQQIAASEGNKTYCYSAWSAGPEFKTYSGIKGPSVMGILSEAGVYDDVTDGRIVHFTADRIVSLTGKQLLNEARYYYPNGDRVDHAAGVVPVSSMDGAVEIPPVICIENGLLCVGQSEPSEENDELFIEGLADESSPGVIEVTSEEAEKCSSVTVKDPRPGSISYDGTAITLGEMAEGEKICYTFEKSVSPGFGCPIYNYGTNSVCKPVLSGESVRMTLKVKVKCYGKKDSTLQTFTFSVGNALTIRIDGETVKAYHDAEDVISSFEAETFSYSGFNTFPTLSFKENVEGIRVESIIEDASGKEISEFDGSSTITFTGSDGYDAVFTMDQLFGTERYYFPNAASGTDNTGGKASPDAYEDKQPVPAIIETKGNNTLRVGQSAPNDQNFPQCVDYMLNLAFIDISTAPAAKCVAPSPVKASGSVVRPGSVVKFPLPSKENSRDKLYYIIDPEPGEIPGPGDAFYYYGAFNWPDETINPPVLSKTGKHTIRIVLTSYGKQDSPARTLTYYVTPAVGKPTLKLTAGKRKITLKWSRVSSVNGYVIYRSTKKTSGYKPIKTIKSGKTTSFVNKKLAKGKKYYYKVRAYRTVGGKKVYGSFSAVKYTKAK